MFVHTPPPKLPKSGLRTVTIKGKRYYARGDMLYPSVTTVLSILSRQSINEWRDRVGHKAADAISGRAARRGTAVHKVCEKYLNNNEDYVNGTTNLIVVDMFKSIQPILDEHVNNIHAQEIMMHSDLLRVAGRADCIAEWDGVLSVIDFKTSNKPKKKEWIKDYFMQCSAYAAMYYERTEILIKDVVVVVAVNQEEPQVFKDKVRNWISPLQRTIRQYNEEYKPPKYMEQKK